ncbi:MAG: hypothetical protein M1833_003135 [Piccolia ochrophora]|nr:MAG: hypothetical protein M1833_003135 [Piccolia ochrophora]
MTRWVVVLLEQISRELNQGHRPEGLESVRVIKDRQTGLSRQFGFLHFSSIDHARAFLGRSYPSIYLYGNDRSTQRAPGVDQATKVRVSFCREQGAREKPTKADDDWECEVCSFPNYARRLECRRCQNPRGTAAPEIPLASYANTGDSDVAPDGTPSQFLLFRGLEPTVSEELLGKGAIKLYRSSGNAAQDQSSTAKKSSAKVASTTGDSNLGAREGSLIRVLLVKDRRTFESWRFGFAEFASIEDAQAALTKFNALDKFTISSKPVLLSFIHAGVFVPVLAQDPGIESWTFSPLNNPSLRLAYWDEGAYVTELRIASDDAPSSSDPKIKGSVTSHAPPIPEAEGLLGTSQSGEGKAKKRKTEAGPTASNKKAVPAHLDFWRNRHAELHGITQKTDANTEENGKEDQPKTQSSKRSTKDPPTQSFADLSRKCCLLCSRQFKTEAEVNKHERLSQLHRTNLESEELKSKARKKLANSNAQEDSPAYRDRARERRAAFNQPKRPAADANPSRAPAPAPDKEEPKEPAPSKGAALLGKMGWSGGMGLGAEGTGMTAPVTQDMYVAGVGLGAQGGKLGDAVDEAGRNTKHDHAEFLERTREKAKERFKQLE